MYAQVEKTKENKSRSVANAVAQKKSNVKQGFGFVDNRESRLVKQTSHAPTLQRQEDTKHTENNVIQMAGHAGVMIFSNDSFLFKRVEKNEAQEFEKIKKLQEAGDEQALNVFPRVREVLIEPKIAPQIDKGRYTKEVNDWIKKHSAGDSYIEIQSVGGSEIDVMDFKIGTVTAEYNDLVRNHKKTPDEAVKKVKGMKDTDDRTESSKYGLRDSDALKSNIHKGISRFFGRYRTTLNTIRGKIKADKQDSYKKDAQVFVDLNNILDFIKTSDTLYIASSLVMSFNKDRSQKEKDRIVLIDLAHPISDKILGKDQLDEIRGGMLKGIRNLILILSGIPISEEPDVRFEFDKKKLVNKNMHLSINWGA